MATAANCCLAFLRAVCLLKKLFSGAKDGKRVLATPLLKRPKSMVDRVECSRAYFPTGCFQGPGESAALRVVLTRDPETTPPLPPSPLSLGCPGPVSPGLVFVPPRVAVPPYCTPRGHVRASAEKCLIYFACPGQQSSMGII